MFRRYLLALTALTLAVGCADEPAPIPTPTPAPPVTVIATRSTLPVVWAAADRSLTGPTPFMIAFAPTQPDLLLRAAQEPIIGVTLFFPEHSPLWAMPLDQEPLAIIVHPSSSIADLSLAQLADIYAGRDTRWAAAVREDGDDSRLYFDSRVLRGVRPAATLRVAASPEAMLTYVETTPNGIGYVPLRWVTADAGVTAITLDGLAPGADGYALTTQVVAFARAEPTGPAREWLGRVQEAFVP